MSEPINKAIRDYEIPRSCVPGKDPDDTFTVQRLLRNAIRTPDGTIIESTHVHDYRTWEDDNGKVYMVDGGLEYLRRSLHEDDPHEDLSVYVDEDHEINREYMMWGTYGPNGDQTFKRVALKDMSTDHIHAVLATQHQIPQWRREIFGEELIYRLNKEMAIKP